MESGSTPRVLGSIVTTGGSVAAASQLANTGSEQVLLSISVGSVVFLATWALLRLKTTQ